MFTVAGTGPRSLQSVSTEEKKAAYSIVASELIRLRSKYGEDLMIMSGMAEGFDKLIATVALEFEIPLWCAIPSKSYGSYYWGKKSTTGQNQLIKFNEMVKSAKHVTYVDQITPGMEGLYRDGKHVNFIRNEFMVSTADAFLIWDASSPGTKNCIKLVQDSGKPYKILNPKEA